jgi:hypothetical protein
MTNYEWLQSLSVEELAEVLNEDLISVPCTQEYCPHRESDGTCGHYDDNLCMQAAINWLNAEHEE